MAEYYAVFFGMAKNASPGAMRSTNNNTHNKSCNRNLCVYNEFMAAHGARQKRGETMLMKFCQTQSYTDIDGSKGKHEVSAIVRFTGCEWEAVRILTETGRPSFAVGQAVTSGAVTPRFAASLPMLRLAGFVPLTDEEQALVAETA